MLKKACSLLLAVFLMVTVFLSSAVTVNADANNVPLENIVYVSKDGREGAVGTIDDPFSTIREARDYLEGKTSASARGSVYIRGGTYFVNKNDPTIELNAENSYVTYSAYQNEEVVISGLVTLDDTKFKKLSEVDPEEGKYSSNSRLNPAVRDKIYVYDLGTEGIDTGSIKKNGFNWPFQTYPPALIVDNVTQTLAQYPNKGGELTRGTILSGYEKNDAIPSGDAYTVWEKARTAGANKGDYPRNYYFDKTDDMKTYEEMLRMKGPIFYVNETGYDSSWLPLIDRYTKWAPPSYENEPQEDQPDVQMSTDNTKYETDGWLSGFFESDYGFDMVRIYSVDSTKQLIHCKYPAIQATQDKRIRLVGLNLLCELDAEGEYYIDRYNGNDILYYYSSGGIGDQKISLTGSDKPLLKIENATGIVIEGIKATGTTANAFELYDCESCTIVSCEFYNISLDAIRIGQNNGTITTDPYYTTSRGGHNNLVTNCYIYDMGGGGVYLAGGDPKTLERGNNVVKNCEFYNISNLRTYTPAVYLEGVGNTMQDNYIHDAPHMAVQVMGNDMLITRNKFINTVWNAEDMGVIYMGRCWTWLGNVISYNYIENQNRGGHAIYLDDGMTGVIINNNIFKDIKGRAVFSNNGFGHQISSNILNNTGGIYLKGYPQQTRPIPNEKVLQYRWYDITRPDTDVAEDATELEKRFTNMPENIEAWYKHYEGIYHNIRNWYYPAASDTAHWNDPDSLFTPSYIHLDHTITVGGSGISFGDTGSQFANPQILDSNTKSFNAMDESGLNLATGKFSMDTPLLEDADYGPAWIDNWNANYNLENIGL